MVRMNAADDRRPQGGRSPFASVSLFSCVAILVALLLVSLCTNAAAVSKDVTSGYRRHDLERRAKMAALRELYARSDNGGGSDESQSDSASSDSASSDSESTAAEARSGAVASFPAFNPVAIDPATEEPTADIGFPAPDIFGALPLFGGAGDMPQASGVGDAEKTQSGTIPSTQGSYPAETCSEAPVCAAKRVMDDGVSFLYESLFNVLHEITVVTIPALLRELHLVKVSARVCSNILFKNASHVVASIKHGRGDARVTVRIRPGLGPGGATLPTDAIYTSGDFSGLGQFRTRVTFNRNGEVSAPEFLIRFPNTERFLAFPVTLQACTRCGVTQSPSFPISLSQVPTATSASAKDTEEALTALIEYTCV